MTKDQLLGIARELATSIGAALVAYGLLGQGTWEAITGLILTLIMLFYAFKANEGSSVVTSLVRKCLSIIGGLAAGAGIVTPEKAEVLIGLAGTVISVAWSFRANGGTLPPATGLIAFALISLSTPSCTGVAAGLTGQTPHSTAVKRVEGESKPVRIATQDLARAETSPEEEVWGLYNVGNVARATQQITDTGK